jgi:hypothetical protein
VWDLCGDQFCIVVHCGAFGFNGRLVRAQQAEPSPARSYAETWVTPYTEDKGSTFGVKGFFAGSTWFSF